MHSESVSNIQAYLAKLRCLFMTRRGGRRDVNVSRRFEGAPAPVKRFGIRIR